ncbi:MAG: hypothetical protein JNL58_24435 [Planctomyces sp.]|nr:hypothetical protein [Planctomyces sp.]
MKSVSAILMIETSQGDSHFRRVFASCSCRAVVLLKLVALFVVLVPGSKLYASCGDYLFRNGRSVSHSMDRLPLTAGQLPTGSLLMGDLSPENLVVGQVFGGVKELVSGGHPPAQRCSGPNCSQSPTPLSSPEVPISNLRGFDQATLMDALESPQFLAGGAEEPVSERGAKRVPSRIFRPPAAF